MKKVWKIVLVISLLCNLGIIYVAQKALEYRGHINEWLDKYVNVVEEFSGRQYYRIDNERLKSDTTVPNRVVLFGTQLIRNYDFQSSFPEYEVVNRGIPGQRAAGMLLRFRPDVIDLGPSAVVLEISSYNLRVPQSLEEIQDYFVSMVDLARENNITPIALTMMPIMADSAFVFENDAYKIADSIGAYNAWLTDYCTRNKVLLVDVYTPLVDSRSFFDLRYARDAINPNQVGYDIIANQLRSNLEQIYRAR
jgi:alpha-L-fucosidase